MNMYIYIYIIIPTNQDPGILVRLSQDPGILVRPNCQVTKGASKCRYKPRPRDSGAASLYMFIYISEEPRPRDSGAAEPRPRDSGTA